jgi:hypothetical protein
VERLITDELARGDLLNHQENRGGNYVFFGKIFAIFPSDRYDESFVSCGKSESGACSASFVTEIGKRPVRENFRRDFSAQNILNLDPRSTHPI